MKTDEISSILGVPAATLFDWSKPGHKRENLAKLLKSISVEEVLEHLETEPKSKPRMLLSTVNSAIGDKSKHFTLTSLKKLFYKKEPLDVYEKFAIKTIKQAALPSEIEAFAIYYKIPKSRIESLLA